MLREIQGVTHERQELLADPKLVYVDCRQQIAAKAQSLLIRFAPGAVIASQLAQQTRQSTARCTRVCITDAIELHYLDAKAFKKKKKAAPVGV